MLLWSSRNYKAHRHNNVINRHRANALSTFKVFVDSSKDDIATKNALLLKSAEAIFSPAITGYLTKEPDNQGTPQILEIVRNINGASHLN